MDLNHRPPVYESGALPLSYAGVSNDERCFKMNCVAGIRTSLRTFDLRSKENLSENLGPFTNCTAICVAGLGVEPSLGDYEPPVQPYTTPHVKRS